LYVRHYDLHKDTTLNYTIDTREVKEQQASNAWAIWQSDESRRITNEKLLIAIMQEKEKAAAAAMRTQGKSPAVSHKSYRQRQREFFRDRVPELVCYDADEGWEVYF
jgi:ATP-dependent Clp protease ATP-binding subunit ClpA